MHDAGLPGVHHIDSVDVVDVLSWRYEHGAASALSSRLGIDPARQQDSPVGGEQPVALLDRLAARIAQGSATVGLIVGAEAQASLNRSRRAGTQPSWPTKPSRTSSVTETLKGLVHPEAWRHGLRAPVDVYPLFENAFRARRGQSLAEGQSETAEIWARMSEVASRNPFSWRPDARSAEEIETVGPTNRWIAFPYSRLMVAAPAVNLAAAILVTTRARARAWGVPEHHLIAPIAAAGAREVSDPLSRTRFDRSAALESTLTTVLARAEMNVSDAESVELYSCFPCVPKMAAEHLGLGRNTPMTVTGGLSFFGGPGNNYMLHATAAMTERLRHTPTQAGLLYGQGEFVTKHHAIVLGGSSSTLRYQASEFPGEPDRVETDHIDLDPRPSGEGLIETYTATWNEDGSPGTGIVVGTMKASGKRFIARTRNDDRASFTVLTDGSEEPVGLNVHVEPGEDVNTAVVVNRRTAPGFSP
ncbi:acetyl-CoA acetyltransferase [Rhodococcus ruber]|nr:acetyl-CoA acetyltransferase [Rhodococcus ruber]